MSNSSILSLPYIDPSQAQKHVTHNEAIRQLDLLVQLSVMSRTETTAPASPTIGDRYIVAGPATGDFAGQENKIALYDDTGWLFVAPLNGWAATDQATGELIIFDGTNWTALSGGGVGSLNNVSGVGINASFDTTNKLSVASDASLFSHNGTGHQMKINKATDTDTASLLYQSNFTGHAEMGLAGNTDFEIKVSPDGTNWNTALQIDAATGSVSFPSGGGGGGGSNALTADTTWYVDPTNGSDSNNGQSAGTGAFATIQHAVDTVLGVNSGGFTMTIQLADDTYALTSPITVNRQTIGGGQFRIIGNTTTPGAVAISSSTEVLICSGVRMAISGCAVSSTGPDYCLKAEDEAFLELSDMAFGAAGQAQIAAIGAHVKVTGNYEITAGAFRHIWTDMLGSFRIGNQTVTLTGTPAFALRYVESFASSLASFDSTVFVGSATGQRYRSAANALINTYGGGESFLPGNVSGSRSNDGRYQ